MLQMLEKLGQVDNNGPEYCKENGHFVTNKFYSHSAIVIFLFVWHPHTL